MEKNAVQIGVTIFIIYKNNYQKINASRAGYKVKDVAADGICCILRVCIWWHININDENVCKLSLYVVLSHTDSQ